MELRRLHEQLVKYRAHGGSRRAMVEFRLDPGRCVFTSTASFIDCKTWASYYHNTHTRGLYPMVMSRMAFNIIARQSLSSYIAGLQREEYLTMVDVGADKNIAECACALTLPVQSLLNLLGRYLDGAHASNIQ